MRKLFFIVALLAAPLTWAASEVVLVSGVKGAVTLEAIGIPKTPLQPFLRLKAGDRLNIPADGQVSLVYFDRGRQEIWPGAAALLIGEQESQKVSGNAEAQFKQLPPQVTKQMQRSTPAPDGKVGAVLLRENADGKVGAVRLRSIGPIDAMTKLENTYKELRASAASADIEPELYLLAGLFEQREYLRLEKEMERISSAFPDDESLKVLRKLYSRAIANARQAGQ
ncbi:MAG: hypothetical protein BWY57_00461 [Betaproteobacteria bacterium ADurb.Bin341]|nr:MAG: hypothetical protein BWY57_00461 [Betaproteobacteria bacterium ADurb.Bin341]